MLPAGEAAAKPAPMLVLVPLASEPAAEPRRKPSTVVGVGPVGERTGRRRAVRRSPGRGLDVTEVKASPDGERRAGVSWYASRQSDERNTHQQLLHSDFPSFQFPPRRAPGRVVPPCEGIHRSLLPSSSSASTGERREPRHGSSAGS